MVQSTTFDSKSQLVLGNAQAEGGAGSFRAIFTCPTAWPRYRKAVTSKTYALLLAQLYLPGLGLHGVRNIRFEDLADGGVGGAQVAQGHPARH